MTLDREARLSIIMTQNYRVDISDEISIYFFQVLKSSYQLETSRRLLFLESLDLFGSWLPSDIKLLSASSEIVEHPSNTVSIQSRQGKYNSGTGH